MIKKLSLFCLVATLLFTTKAFAAGTTDSGTINYINAGNGVVFIRFESPYTYGSATNNPDSCPNIGNFILKDDNSNYKDIYAALLTGKATGDTMRLFVDGCFGPSTNQFPLITSITIL